LGQIEYSNRINAAVVHHGIERRHGDCGCVHHRDPLGTAPLGPAQQREHQHRRATALTRRRAPPRWIDHLRCQHAGLLVGQLVLANATFRGCDR